MVDVETAPHDERHFSVKDDLLRCSVRVCVILSTRVATKTKNVNLAIIVSRVYLYINHLAQRATVVRMNVEHVSQADSARAKAALEGHDKSRRALQSSLKFKTVGEIETAIRQMEARQVCAATILNFFRVFSGGDTM